MTAIKSIALLSYVALASAACTRSSLQGVLDAFFKASIAKTSPTATIEGLSFAPTIRISQNNQILPSVAASAYNNITGFYKPFNIKAIDPEICTIATFVLANQKSDAGGADVPSLMSIRIKTGSSGTSVEELEILNVLKGSHAFFAPQTFPESAPEMWSASTSGNLSRTELIRIANLYPSGIQAGDGSAIPGAPTCPRIENGVQTTPKCYTNLAMFKQPVTNRRWVADTLTGVVLGEFYFDKPASRGLTYGLWLNEYFKIDNGKMAGIHAAMKELSGVPFVDVWGPKK
jgi:hypothetical protein